MCRSCSPATPTSVSHRAASTRSGTVMDQSAAAERAHRRSNHDQRGVGGADAVGGAGFGNGSWPSRGDLSVQLRERRIGVRRPPGVGTVYAVQSPGCVASPLWSCAAPRRAAPRRAAPCRAAPCRAVPRRAVPCRAVPRRAGRAGPCRVGPRRAVPCRAGPGRVGPCRAGPCRVGPCRAGPCRVGPRRAVPGRAGRVDRASARSRDAAPQRRCAPAGEGRPRGLCRPPKGRQVG